MKRTYTVTGGTGYIGSKLLEHLSKDKNNYIYALIREGSNPKILADNIEYFTHDGTEKSLEGPLVNSDYLIHLGALYSVRRDEETVRDLILSNVLLSTQLFNAANSVNQDIVITTTSTFSALDNKGNYKPASLYAATKKAVEDIAYSFTELSIHFLTLPDTYGPSDWRPKIHNILGRNEKWPFQFRSRAEQEIRMLHVEDVIGHLLSSLEQTEKGVHIHDVYMEGTLITLEDLSKKVTDKKCLFNDNAEMIALPKSVRRESVSTGYENQHQEVSFSWFK